VIALMFLRFRNCCYTNVNCLQPKKCVITNIVECSKMKQKLNSQKLNKLSTFLKIKSSICWLKRWKTTTKFPFFQCTMSRQCMSTTLRGGNSLSSCGSMMSSTWPWPHYQTRPKHHRIRLWATRRCCLSPYRLSSSLLFPSPGSCFTTFKGVVTPMPRSGLA